MPQPESVIDIDSENRSRWFVRPAVTADEPVLLDLFRHSFGHEMPSSLWRWKYSGLSSAGMLAECDNKAVAFYGGMPRNILYFGEKQRAVQIGDVMVAPEERSHLTRRGAFFHVASAFLSANIGYDKPFLLGFGFPTKKALRLAEHLGLYETVGSMVELCWAPSPGRPSWSLNSRTVGVNAAASVRTKLDQLWSDMASSLDTFIIGERNWAWLNQRYFSHPTVEYKLQLICNRFGQKPIALVIYREQNREIELMDIIARPEHFLMALGWLRRYAGRAGMKAIKFWLTRAASALFEHTYASMTLLDLKIPCNIWSPGPEPSSIAERWWLTAGDTDFR
jgi:hypothetical protein